MDKTLHLSIDLPDSRSGFVDDVLNKIIDGLAFDGVPIIRCDVPKTCKTCKWWRFEADMPVGSNICDNEETQAELRGIDLLVTWKDFGCIHHEEKGDDQV